MGRIVRTGLGQDHHRYKQTDKEKGFLRLAGLDIPFDYCFEANSDGDVILHALVHACSSLSGQSFLGPPADRLCALGIKDSAHYWAEPWKELQNVHPGIRLVHAAISIEAKAPKLYQHLETMRFSLSRILDLPVDSIGITATTGEGLTDMGRGEGMAVLALLTTEEPCFCFRSIRKKLKL